MPTGYSTNSSDSTCDSVLRRLTPLGVSSLLTKLIYHPKIHFHSVQDLFQSSLILQCCNVVLMMMEIHPRMILLSGLPQFP